jgi:phenylpropionate dioxygenase-like ring-hydroxylating dioxygenase large terminal subunit
MNLKVILIVCTILGALAAFLRGESSATGRSSGVIGRLDSVEIRVFREDELILEAQQRAMDENPDRIFYNLNIDAGSMWARRIIDRMVAAERAPQAVAAE